MTEIERYLKRVFRYDPETGFVTQVLKNYVWKKDHPVNLRVGTICRGYETIQYYYNGKKNRIVSHRLAFLFMTGSLPPDDRDVDHINGKKNDNSWSNLRIATRSQNNMNSENPRNNKTGQKGVHPNRHNGWQARIKVNGKVIHLGCFKVFEDAVNARKKAEAKYFGEFKKG